MTARTVQAAEILADAWHGAMELTARIARENGYQQGWHAGRAEEHEKWNQIIAAFDVLRKVPTRAERAEMMREDGPCDPECGRCSRCVRAASVARHGGDFPGREQVAS